MKKILLSAAILAITFVACDKDETTPTDEITAPVVTPIDTIVVRVDTTVTPIDTVVTPIDTTVVPIDTTVRPIVISFSQTIQPLLTQQCTFSGCHSTGSGLGDFTSYTGIKIDSDNGKLNTRVIVMKTMPIGSGSLTSTDRDLIDKWLKAGALNN